MGKKLLPFQAEGWCPDTLEMPWDGWTFSDLDPECSNYQASENIPSEPRMKAATSETWKSRESREIADSEELNLTIWPYNTSQPYHKSLFDRDIIPAGWWTFQTTSVAGCVLDLRVRVRRGSYAQVKIKILLAIWKC